MKIANLIRKRPREAVATAIPATCAAEPGSREVVVAKIATVAVAKPDEGRVEGTAPSIQASYWLLHFLDREPREMFVAPPMTHAEVLAAYPDAVGAQPVPERTDTRTATLIERDELLALVGAVYAADTDADRAEAMAAALADPAGALECYRAIANERVIEVRASLPTITKPTITVATGCKSCRHRRRPGRVDPGYCSERGDLEPAYTPGHPLRRLRADQGVTCTSYLRMEG